jgi:hypothetical protein
MELPEGTPTSGKICRLHKGFYGLKQSPRCWNNTFNNFLNDYGLERSGADQCVYHSEGTYGTIILSLYVDDGLLYCSLKETMEGLIKKLQKIQSYSRYTKMLHRIGDHKKPRTRNHRSLSKILP